MNTTPIEWCRTYAPDGSYTPGYSSNPVYVLDKTTGKRGWHCVKQDASCDHCYAEALNKRWGTGRAYTHANDDQVEWVLSEKELAAWDKLDAKLARTGATARMFVGDMLDLFHPDIPGWMLDRIFATVSRCPRITFMFLTKQARRMQAVAARVAAEYGGPLPHVWWGVSCALQKALWRVWVLCETPAAVRFVSYEPAIEYVDFHLPELRRTPTQPGIDWLILGGESGGGARPFALEWARGVLAQCRAAGVAPFVKQLGTAWARQQEHRDKGGDVGLWPADLQVREFPAVGVPA